MPAAETFIARQPIFDRRDAVVGYELLFRDGPENAFSAIDVDLASSQNLERTVMGFGLDVLTEGRAAFVNVTRQVLLDELYTLLPPDRAVIELLETVEPDRDVVDACKRLKKQGYRLALDDFVYRPDFDPLLALADIIKVDFRTGPTARDECLAGIRSAGASLLAEKVETQGERSEAESLGFEYYQGYYYCKPQMLAGRSPAPSHANYLRLLCEVSGDEVSFERVEAIIRAEVAFSVRLLRYLNSAAFGWRHEVKSLDQAIRLLGERPLRKWVSAVATVELATGKPSHLVTTGLVRARFSELLAEPAGLGRADLDLFFVGLLSVMDAILDQPLPDVIASMAVSPALAAGLLDRAPPFGPVLELVIAAEQGHWDALDNWAGVLGARPDTIREAHAAAAGWATSLAKAA